VATFDRAKSTEDIRHILFTYPECIDRGNIDGVVELLTGVKMCNSNGVNAISPPDDEIPVLSASEVRSMYSGVILYEGGLPHTKHVITNFDIRFSEDGTRADTRSYYVVLQGFDDFPLQIVITGRYEDTYQYNGTAWKLTIRREFADLLGDLSRHIKPELLAQLQTH
jgi:SnoaL-like domain